ncbi:MAG: ArsR family transcriptional regulator [Candidatus Marinimicrobia bacterium]|jgi:ribosomal protein L12E/L44/L45/RPP1/RPP2|nr:ArsR family transcriptional regulator [Candidatus Neomarinimicrobiota bacterium]
MEFSELVDSDRRLVILRALEEDAGYSLNESVIQSVLEALGHNVSRDRVRTDLVWLKEQGLLTIEEVVKVYVATITARGADVVHGRATVPGVKRPSPRNR